MNHHTISGTGVDATAIPGKYIESRRGKRGPETASIANLAVSKTFIYL
jgi:hypothetical protein